MNCLWTELTISKTREKRLFVAIQEPFLAVYA